MKQFYDANTEQLMQLHYSHLSEKDKRHYAAVECKKLSRGGQIYLMQLLKVSQKTIEKGKRELENPKLYAEIPIGKSRRPGGGRKIFLQQSNA